MTTPAPPHSPTSPTSPVAPADRLPLRERKKLRTRQALIDTALELFTERGFDGTTLDDLCEAVEVSKRTFFRTFSSKEDVATAPLHDMWTAFLDDLESRASGGRSVLEMLQEALLATLGRMTAEGWARRVRLSHLLAEKTPSMDAHGLHFCDRTSRAALAILHHRLALADPHDLRPRLAIDMLVAAFHRALETWTSQPGPATRADLAAHVRDAFAAIPGSLTLTAGPRDAV
ncbi:TetR/AcrR family transcriptional regulator [Streptosporangium sp. V21-05]|uniref:TetR/AcrR family transcriptional regulator n=1 Tax=Streptosporangium sp. V21-05 TaxID=3446115 RepID=UPI003F52D1F0